MDNENFNEESALAVFKELAKKNRILAKPVRVENDRQAITFFFLAPEKTDFHLLSRDLNRHFKTHIELKQISGKEAAKGIPGCGKCGRPLCCRTFLKNPPNYSIDDLKKAYNIKGSIDDLTGSCGKLLCCLVFEPPVERTEPINDIPQDKFVDLAHSSSRPKSQSDRDEWRDLSPLKDSSLRKGEARNDGELGSMDLGKSGINQTDSIKKEKHKNQKIVRRLILNR